LKLAIRTSQYFGATESNGPGIGVGARLSTRSAWRPNCYLASASCGVQSLRYVGRRWVGFRSACEPVRASLVRFFKPAAARRSIMPSRWSMPPQPDQLRRWHDRQHNGEGSSDTVLAPCAAATTVHRRNVIRQRPRIGRLVMANKPMDQPDHNALGILSVGVNGRSIPGRRLRLSVGKQTSSASI
jgi:hypothetical protein